MKLRYITLISKRDCRQDFPRAHLRWIELDKGGLKLGFSSIVFVLRGKNLDLLVRDLVTGSVDVIHERPERPVGPGDWEVHCIQAGE